MGCKMSHILAAWLIGLPMAFFINTVPVILRMGGTKICTELNMKIQALRHEMKFVHRSIKFNADNALKLTYECL
jgi:hypothetical protein